MRFIDREPSEEQLRSALVSGLIAVSTLVPVVVTVSILYRDRNPWATPWGIVALAVMGTIAVAVPALIAVQGRRGHVRVPPAVGFAILVGCLVAIMGAVVGAHASLAFYLPAVILVVFFGATIGDRSMRSVILVVATVVVGVTGWQQGLRGWALVTIVVMYAWIGGVLSGIVGRAMRQLVRNAARQRGVASIAETIGDAETVVAGLRVALPHVGEALPTDHVVVAVRDDQGAVTPLDVWPSGEAGDGDLLARPELTRCLADLAPTLGDGHCFVPAGYDGTAQYVVVARIVRKPGDSKLHILGPAASLAGVFLRLTSRVAFMATLQRETRTDPLTGLPNRRGLLERLQADFARAARSRHPVCVAMIDLDHFKRYNDTHGHVAGDRLLASVTAALAATCRAQDLLVRYGGDELCLVLPETGVDGAAELAGKLRRAAAEAAGPSGVTLSVGVAAWDGAEDAVTLIGRADQALYRAKRDGGDRVVAAEEAPRVEGPTSGS